MPIAEGFVQPVRAVAPGVAVATSLVHGVAVASFAAPPIGSWRDRTVEVKSRLFALRAAVGGR